MSMRIGFLGLVVLLAVGLIAALNGCGGGLSHPVVRTWVFRGNLGDDFVTFRRDGTGVASGALSIFQPPFEFKWSKGSDLNHITFTEWFHDKTGSGTGEISADGMTLFLDWQASSMTYSRLEN